MNLALDLGGNLGFCYYDATGVKKHGFKRLLKSTKKEDRGRRLVHWLAWLSVNAAEVDLIVFEQVEYSPTQYAAQAWGAFFGVMALFCETHGPRIEYRGFNVSTLKKLTTGNGRAQKADMIEAARRITGEPITDDNEADAVCLANLAAKGAF